MIQKRILYCEGNIDGTVGGSYYILYDLVTNLDKKKYFPIVIFYNENVVAEKLRKKGIETHVFNRTKPISFKIKNEKKNNFISTINLGIGTLQKIINLFIRLIFPAFRYAKYLKKNNIDMVNLNNSIVRNHDWMLGSLIAGVKCITHEMGINDEFSWLSRYFAKRLKSIICLSEAIRQNMVNCGIDYSYIVTIHCGLDVERYKIKETPEQLRNKYKIDKNIPTIGVVGNIKMWKGQETVVRAMKLIENKIPNIKCFIIGDVSKYKFDQEYYSMLKQLTLDLEIEENIVFTGFQENPIDYMNFVDIVIHSSIKPEPFGIVVLEAMAVKKPLIATNFGGPAEIIKNNETGFLVPAENPKALSDKVIEVFSDIENANNIGIAGFQRLNDSFTLVKNVSETEKVYDNIFS